MHVMSSHVQALESAGLQAKDIDQVVLVGGTTRVPKVCQQATVCTHACMHTSRACQVREELTRFFGKPPNSDIDPDQAVAVGVAVQGDNAPFLSFALSSPLLCYP